MGSCEDFAAIANLLQEDFCCLLIDLPGHGKTEVSCDLDYQMPKVAIAIMALLKQLAIDRCFLVGYSMGGRLALYLAVFFPQHFDKVVLESASPGLENKQDRDNRIKRDLKIANKLISQDFNSFLQDWYANPLFSAFVKHPNYHQAIAKRLKNNPNNLAKSLKYMGLGVQPSLWKELASIQLPILLVAGELDPKFVAIGRRISCLSPQFQLKIVKNTDHNVHFEQSLDFVRLLSIFLKL